MEPVRLGVIGVGGMGADYLEEPGIVAEIRFTALCDGEASMLACTGVGWIVLLLARERLKVQPSMAGLAAAVRGAEKQTVEGPRAEPAPERPLKP